MACLRPGPEALRGRVRSSSLFAVIQSVLLLSITFIFNLASLALLVSIGKLTFQPLCFVYVDILLYY